MINGVIFDMDGTMFDTERMWATFWDPALKALGLPYKEGLAEAARGTAGETTRNVVRSFYGPDCDADGIVESLHRVADEVFLSAPVPKKPGLDALLAARPDLAGCMFLPGDQPLLQRETVESMVGIFGRDTKTRIEQQKETEREIFRLAHRFINDPNPLVGSPVLFSKRYFSELRILPEGKGGSVLLRKYPERVHNIFIGDRNELLDADTPEALAELLRILRQ